MALLGRFLVGVGSGVAFLSAAKIAKTNFDEQHHSVLLELAFTFRLVGAVFGVTPMKHLFDMFRCNDTFNALAVVCSVITRLIKKKVFCQQTAR